ncbi:hypothetical protein A1O3_06674 [Capronia epimyces CBS 606.96]|uniref:Fumarylacetoacetase-like C-terminal domain-containing protein n=1 Tax=Capronia epimyces CBS 606.96 TaxID=1182542 RepID=W9YKT7_9EURO|nr:uncharacterized protein A1O3_06674 [Capronia epimyces CBS 606.96]EXJ82859.1 hypothetical protein A1O3_06674 [Capronia epimyces CBS 606.96]
MSWTHLVRFDHKGSPTFAQLVEPKENGELDDQIKVNIATGNPVRRDIKLTDEIVTVDKKDLLPPVADVPIVYQTGLNYKAHVEEATEVGYKNLPPPRPYLFWRPAGCLAGPYATIDVHPVQQDSLDYEGELIILVGYEPFKDVTVEEAKKQIIGYTVGNDLSPRPGPKLGAMNYIWSKGFDKFTPIGPVLVSADVLGVPPQIELYTRVDGKVVQQDNTKNMTFNVAELVASMATGTTVQPGTVAFTGTCGGGQWFTDQGKTHGVPDGSVCEVEFEKIGKIANKVHFL